MHRISAIGLAGALTLAVWASGWASGCASDGGQPPDAAGPPPGILKWETKSRSVISRDPMPSLSVPEPYQMHGGPELRAASIEMLLEATASSSALLRANAIESLQLAPEHLDPVLRIAVNDENRGVRFVAAMTIGKLRMTELIDVVEPMLDDDSPSVQAAAIYAMRRCGRSVDPTPLAAMVLSDDPEVKGNAAMVLGKLGDASALPLLRDAVRHDLPRSSQARRRMVDLQIAEAMVKLGQVGELEVIRAALFTPVEQGEIAVLACLICGELGDHAYVSTLFDLATRVGPTQPPPEIRLAAVQSIARLEPGRAPGPIVRDYLTFERPEIRAQAAGVLGWIGDATMLPALAAMLKDPDPAVQVSAAGGILRLSRIEASAQVGP